MKAYIKKQLVVYDSITKEKHVKTVYFVRLDTDTDSIHWSSKKAEARIFEDEETYQMMLKELNV